MNGYPPPFSQPYVTPSPPSLPPPLPPRSSPPSMSPPLLPRTRASNGARSLLRGILGSASNLTKQAVGYIQQVQYAEALSQAQQAQYAEALNQAQQVQYAEALRQAQQVQYAEALGQAQQQQDMWQTMMAEACKPNPLLQVDQATFQGLFQPSPMLQSIDQEIATADRMHQQRLLELQKLKDQGVGPEEIAQAEATIAMQQQMDAQRIQRQIQHASNMLNIGHSTASSVLSNMTVSKYDSAGYKIY
ncbi:hypothetical protein BGW38_005756 [Lunasporangiospora selenospora]|uniref:Uncharacterized protein n=1 Tax=Lunasporangiospora selenospora TaxID=979761 RepID=A0A9P6FMM2_9FUNG|nr:hypothetical protein BGW38_005756 [Lunasporangiospora selenospora]